MAQRLDNIRNFCIIAHIDHGKTTLSDRILELTKAIDLRNLRAQTLDAMDLERERGITIKSHPVSMAYIAKDGKTYLFNLIDTPGHVDFNYEVSRSMGACEGAVLVVDAAQGVEAQTVANAYLAIDNELEIVPVLNKVDLPGANIEEVSHQIEDVLGIPMDQPLYISAKTGLGVSDVLEAIVARIPPPETAGADAPLRALVFDSVFDEFRGVITYVRVVDGRIKAGDAIRYIGSGQVTQLREVGIFSPDQKPVGVLEAGQVGYLVGTIKDPADIKIGDTVTWAKDGTTQLLPGFKEVRPMVFSGIYPVSTDEFEKVRSGLEKLHLNDSAFTFHAESSVALGFGFRCGFLGLLHMEVVQERLRREFDLDIINTHPSVVYRVQLKDGVTLELDNPVQLPDVTRIEQIEEPMIKATIICPSECIGDIMRIALERRGEVKTTESLDARRVILTCTLPLNEILIDFHDMLKSVSHGYASMDYEPCGYQVSDIVKMDILLNGELVDAFSTLVHRDKAVSRGRQMCKALADTIPPHMFKIPVQATIGRTIIAREDIRAFRKDVLAKLYGGDVTRKQKLLKKQKAGKARMKEFGQVNVPQSAFISVLKGTAKDD
ncbi:MAG: translation elongation factor 4 [Kiritimatiellia bacterium]|jgi:GTP-binding protein LepA|nr:translation elongation factor 4 [Kiritimatiellia bacterium]MDD4174778.1 translation elongation factor 4 [Kiritimatiellia bacterium]MDD4440581.1 translation elongation factor 4 [Kiritimatiellia bacterium]MDX9792415.1 translation elongation factor 4 [Kiritimatiellia bacterium]